MKYEKEAMENAKDMVKLLITLSTGIIVFSGTFLKAILQTESKNFIQLVFLFGSWLFLTISIFCGVFLAYGRIISLINEHSYNTSDKRFSGSVKAQELFFLAGIVSFGIFIVIAIV